MTIKVGVVGASGRTGSQVIAALSDFPGFALTAAIVSKTSTMLGQPCGSSLYTNDFSLLSSCDVVIEFASADTTASVIEVCQRGKIPLLIGTTGHTDEQRRAIKEASLVFPVLVAPNTSLGVFALRALSRLGQEILGKEFDIRMLDLHHGRKKDAPSGTARHLAEGLGLDLSSDFNGTPPVVALRGGDEPGQHSIFFLGKGERLEISHVVHDRATFGRGAIKLAEMLLGKSPGLYNVDDLLSRK